MEGAWVLRLITAAGAACAVFASASSAFAASASVGAAPGEVVDYRAGAGEANAVTATVFESTVTIADGGAAITPGSGCATIDPHTVQCALSSLPAQLAADLGDANDTLMVSGTLDTFADAGAGDDRLSGGGRQRRADRRFR